MKTISRTIKALTPLLLILFFMSCDNKHDWEDGKDELKNEFFFAFEKWGQIPGGNNVTYKVNQGDVIAIPTEFHSVQVLRQNPEVFYYVISADSANPLQLGEDYLVEDEEGNTITPKENGSFGMVWPNAKGGVQNIYIKALNKNKGSLKVLTFDPEKKMDVTDRNTTYIVKTNDYSIRAFSENYYVTLIIQ